ncbi:MAG: septal ring lytic transglycosylase RlpA family protein [Woeseiaceae bacterium]|nr:septal ring lytic transglycosylase RlpA family protein [Woeseiaceae bacterium]
MKHERVAALLLSAAAIALLPGCGSGSVRDGAPSGGSATIPTLPGDAVPRPEPKSRYGNGPVYEVFGKQYSVMDSSHGYRERGVASWYGKKFHGNLTSNRETYDMYQMTAAHKTLPLPTYVKVRNLRNNKSVVVRVNDRGPFVHNRIIDLSYSAALKLDMVQDGTSLVEVTAISFDEPAGPQPVRATSTPPPRPVAEPEPVRSEPRENVVYAQVGAFGSRDNAERRIAVLKRAGIYNAAIYEDLGGSTPLYRVRIGPIREVIAYDILVEELENIDIFDPYLITE